MLVDADCAASVCAAITPDRLQPAHRRVVPDTIFKYIYIFSLLVGMQRTSVDT